MESFADATANLTALYYTQPTPGLCSQQQHSQAATNAPSPSSSKDAAMRAPSNVLQLGYGLMEKVVPVDAVVALLALLGAGASTMQCLAHARSCRHTMSLHALVACWLADHAGTAQCPCPDRKHSHSTSTPAVCQAEVMHDPASTATHEHTCAPFRQLSRAGAHPVLDVGP